jgi:hypothetical protein
MDTDQPSDFSLVDVSPQQRKCLHAAAFQAVKVPLDSCWITHAENHITKLQKCDYIFEDSTISLFCSDI